MRLSVSFMSWNLRSGEMLISTAADLGFVPTGPSRSHCEDPGRSSAPSTLPCGLAVRSWHVGAAKRPSQVLRRLDHHHQAQHGEVSDPLLRVSTTVSFLWSWNLISNSSDLAEGDASQLLQSLTGWFVRSLTEKSGAVVIRKLASALVTFFIQFSHLWPGCVRHLLYCLDIGHVVARDESENAPTSDLISSLSETSLLGAIWFITVLVEEVARTEMKSQKR